MFTAAAIDGDEIRDKVITVVRKKMICLTVGVPLISIRSIGPWLIKLSRRH
jgi:hypothetical protein